MLVQGIRVKKKVIIKIFFSAFIVSLAMAGLVSTNFILMVTMNGQTDQRWILPTGVMENQMRPGVQRVVQACMQIMGK